MVDTYSDASVTGLTADDVVRFVELAKAELNLEQGGTTVFTLDIPDVPQHYASVMVAQANQAAAGKERAIGYCGARDYLSPDYKGMVTGSPLYPEYIAAEYFKLYEKKEVNVPPPGSAKLVVWPKHGSVIYNNAKLPDEYHLYLPEVGYVGDEKMVFRVNVDGKIVKVVYLLKMTDKGADSAGVSDLLCKETGHFWKISSTNNDPTGQLLSFNAPNQLTSYLAGAINANVNIADLTDGAVGQTTATTITLDDNAAGHGWFIDSTPGSNEEWLPTHNPNEWIAKAGSDAAGKMDMLSVLLHEYGHVLGIGHSIYAGFGHRN